MTLRETGWGCGLVSSSSGQRPLAESVEQDNEYPGYIQCRDFHEWLRNCWRLMKDLPVFILLMYIRIYLLLDCNMEFSVSKNFRNFMAL